MMIPIFATVIRALWLITEVPYVLRFKVKPAKDWDRHSAKLWDCASGIETVGLVVGFTSIGHIQIDSRFIGIPGLVLLVAGIAIRWTAVYTLGKYFTGTVLIKSDHRLVRAGLYRYLRHPAYTGTLIAHLGLGLSFSNWFTLCLSFFPFLIAALYRMHVEERALVEAFGEEYLGYSRDTRRLIPGVY